MDAPDLTANLCMNCHNRGTTPPNNFSNSTATSTKRGAHASQGGIVLGQGAGYIPRYFSYDTVRAYTSHASLNNPRLCAGCHVNSFTVTDAATGAFVLQSVGHLFSPDPCLDASGQPIDDNSCAYLPEQHPQLDWLSRRRLPRQRRRRGLCTGQQQEPRCQPRRPALERREPDAQYRR